MTTELDALMDKYKIQLLRGEDDRAMTSFAVKIKKKHKRNLQDNKEDLGLSFQEQIDKALDLLWEYQEKEG